MKEVRLIAWREFLQYLRARGFLITLLLVPLWLVVSALLHHLLSEVQPQRRFAVIDDAGGFLPAVDRRLAFERAESDLESLKGWARKNVDLNALKISLPSVASMLERDVSGSDVIDAFLADSGVEGIVPLLQPHLRPGATPYSRPDFHLLRVEVPRELASAARAHDAAALLPVLRGERRLLGNGDSGPLFALIVIPPGFSLDRPHLDYWSENQADPAVREFLQRALLEELRARTAAAAGLNAATTRHLLQGGLDITPFNPSNLAAKGAVGEADDLRILFPYVVALLLLLSILSIASMLLIAVIEEKSSRIVEMILASVSPNRLMLGKLLGAAGAALVMMIGWLIGGAIMITVVATAPPAMVMQILVRAHVFDDFALIGVCFACGLAVYTMIFLSLGAMARSFHEAQSYLGPLMFVLFAPMGFLVIVHNEPNGWLATLLSFSPLHAPFFLMIRLARHPPLLTTGLAFICMVLSAAAIARVMARGFARNILRTEASASLWPILFRGFRRILRIAQS